MMYVEVEFATMSNAGPFEGAEPGTRARKQLRQIAETLGCPIEELKSNGRLRDELSGATELLQLWANIEASRVVNGC